MNSVIRRDPFFDITSMVNRVFDEPFVLLRSNGGAGVEEGTLALDVSENDQAVIVRASLPGFRKEDVTVEVHDGVLTINAKQEEVKEEKTERYYRKERRVGSLSRRIALPAPVVDEDSNAELRDGVLTVRIPKSAKASPRRVQIK